MEQIPVLVGSLRYHNGDENSIVREQRVAVRLPSKMPLGPKDAASDILRNEAPSLLSIPGAWGVSILRDANSVQMDEGLFNCLPLIDGAGKSVRDASSIA